MLRRLFQYDLDAYFLFRAPTDSRGERLTAIPNGYEVRLLNLDNHTEMSALVPLWVMHSSKSSSNDPVAVEAKINGLVDDGNLCVGVFSDSELIGMAWIGFAGALGIEGNRFSKLLKKIQNPCYTHNMYISPDHRGRFLMEATIDAKKKLAEDRRVDTIYTFVGVSNFASIAVNMRKFKEYRLIYHLSIDIPFMKLDFFPTLSRTQWRLGRSRGQSK